MVVLFHFTKSQSRETGKCGVPSLVSLEAPDSGGSPPDSPRGGSLPSLGLCKGQEWRGHGRSLSTQLCSGGRDASARAGGRKIPGSNSALWAPGTTAVARLGQHSSYPTAVFDLHHWSLQTKMQVGPFSSQGMPLTSALPDSPPPWLSRKGWGGEICPKGS